MGELIREPQYQQAMGRFWEFIEPVMVQSSFCLCL
jgi:hypothetical protein